MPDLEEVNKIINGSGNKFHCKVTNYLKEKGWSTLVSPYYMDSASNKPREIDLIAEKAFRYADRFDRQLGTINIQLFIECKYIPNTNVFWFAEKDIVSARKWVSVNTPLRDNNIYTDKHHYINSCQTVAKLFASQTKPAIENEVIYKALNQSLNAMVSLRQRASITPRSEHEYINTTVKFPVVLCHSFKNFFCVEFEEDPTPKEITENFQLEVNYAYIDSDATHRDEYFLLDIVDFQKLDDFLSVLEADVKAIQTTLAHTF